MTPTSRLTVRSAREPAAAVWRIVCWTLFSTQLASAGARAAEAALPTNGASGTPTARFDQLLAGSNGDASVQFIELRTPPSEIEGHLRFHDATGEISGEIAIRVGSRSLRHTRHDTGSHQRRRSVLIATTAFEAETGLAPDILMPPLLRSVDGMVCWHASRRRSEPTCVAYGDYQGPAPLPACFGRPVVPTPELPIAGETPLALVRIEHASHLHARRCPKESSYELRAATVRDRAGELVALEPRTIVEQGRNLFSLETFGGNGRTCATCHDSADAFGLSPSRVVDRFDSDPEGPLFVAEVQPALATLENACLLREGNQRALILENIAGFDQPAVFRTSPHLRNIALTAPYGHSSGLPDLRTFSLVAVEQHFPRTLARNTDPTAGGLDFRIPAPFELAALEAFMNTIRFPADGNLDLDRMIEAAIADGHDRASIDRGRSLFFGEVGRAQCIRCHGGTTLSVPDGSLGSMFDIGVGQRPGNSDDGCAGGPGDPTAALPTDVALFDIPPLIGVAGTAPFFHDNSAPNLRKAVAHYTSDAFASSPAGAQFDGRRRIVLSDDEIEDIATFLEAISVDPTASTAPIVSIVVDPFSHAPFVDLASRQPIVIAIRGDRTFQVEDIDSSALQLEPGGVSPATHRFLEIDGDGQLDLVLEFPVQGAGLALGDDEVCISGAVGETPFEACDPVPVGWLGWPGCGRGHELALAVVPLLVVASRRRR